MLDTYWWGNVDRISPEGPVPVVSVELMVEVATHSGAVVAQVVTLLNWQAIIDWTFANAGVEPGADTAMPAAVCVCITHPLSERARCTALWIT